MQNEPISVDQVSALAFGLRLPMGLVIDEISLDAPSATIIPNPFQFSAPTDPTLKVVISAEGIAAFLEQKSPGGLKNFRVTIAESIVIQAAAKIIIDIQVSATCHLSIEEGKRLIVVLDDVGVLGVGAKNLVQQQIDQVNPIFDAATLPFNLELTDVTLGEGKVTLTAQAHLSS